MLSLSKHKTVDATTWLCKLSDGHISPRCRPRVVPRLPGAGKRASLPAMRPVVCETSLTEGCEALATADRDLGRAYRAHGLPPLRYRPPTYDTLLRIIVAQQVSVASANAIWGRLQERLDAIDQDLTPAAFLSLGDADLRTVGFSRQKTAYGRAIADDLASGRVDLDTVEALDDEAAIAELVKLKGIGRWSAECFLLFSYGRPDVWPADDVGLMIGMERIKGLKKRPDAKRMRRLAKPWSPWRGVAARLLWHVRKLEVI